MVLDKSLVRDSSFDSRAEELDATFQLAVPTHLVMEWVVPRHEDSPAEDRIVTLAEKLRLTPGAVACPIPSFLLQAEMSGDRRHASAHCSPDLLERIRSGDRSWIGPESLLRWRSQVGEGVQGLMEMTRLIPKMVAVSNQGDVTEPLLSQVAEDRVMISSRIYDEIWRPQFGASAPGVAGPATASRIQVLFMGALSWFGKYGLTPDRANPGRVFNEVVDLDIRTLGIILGGLGSLDRGSQSMFKQLNPSGILVT
ncbi:MAG: hypothetical protein IPJ17_18290 [Holophagales bacterium]|nr:MAG: hypothetical protein IPJ17_18290 [Holophagales bacterium]